MGNLKVGFARTVINPMIGIGISGYYKTRICDGKLDDLETNIIALSNNGKTALLISVDTLKINACTANEIKRRINDLYSIGGDAVFISATHTHLGAYVGYVQEDAPEKLTDIYTEQVISATVSAVKTALDDRKNAKVGFRVKEIEDISFIRRYKMKDGSIVTNPGVNNPDISEPTSQPDKEVTLVRFDRENGETIVLANFACHPDTIGGNKFSAEWPGFFRRTFEKAVDNTKCIFFNGAQGDINHIKVFPKGGDMNNMEIGFDGVPRGYSHAEFMGRAIAGAVLQMYDKVEYVDSDSVGYAQKIIELPTNKATEEELKEAHRIHQLHSSGRDEELNLDGMMLTTAVAEAERMCNLENGPDTVPMCISAVSVGEIVLVGAAGEMFNKIGEELKKANNWKAVLPCSLTNGAEGYFPMMDSYIEGGYEARASVFKPGVGELIIKESFELLKKLK